MVSAVFLLNLWKSFYCCFNCCNPPPPPLPLSTLSDLTSGFGRKDVVDHLLQTGANVHARDDGGLIPLHNACSFGHSEVRFHTATFRYRSMLILSYSSAV